MNNVVYIKTFDNGKKYVGITNNFNKRMYNHQYAAYTKDSQLAVHRAMRKHSHETEIVFRSDSYEEVKKMEITIIQSLKDCGYELYNLTNGGEGTTGYIISDETKKKMSEAKKGKYNGEKNPMYGKTGRNHPLYGKTGENSIMYGKKHSEETKKKISEASKGEKNHSYKDFSHFETNSILRSHFKRKCKRANVDFDDYEETFANKYYNKPNGERVKKYYYKKNKKNVKEKVNEF